MYHYVRELKTSKYKKINFLDLKEFKRQISHLKKNFNIIKIEDILDLQNDKKKYKKPFSILTFDDGFIDHYKYVFPILKKNNLQGVFFPPTKIFKKNFILDVHKIQFLLSKISNKKFFLQEISDRCKKKYNFDIEKINKKKLILTDRYDNKELSLTKKLLQFILPQKMRNETTDYFFKKYVTKDKENFRKDLYMSKKNIKEMLNAGMHFGSHSSNHEWMQYLNENEQEKEIKNSLNFLRKNFNLKKDYYSFCYPYGSYNKKTIELLEKYNFKIAFTTEPKPFMKNQRNNLLKFPRFDTNDFR